MLCSPTADANGYSTTFQPSDFLALRAGGSCRAAATEANEWMCAAAQYLAAYGSRIESLTKAKQLDNFDVRLVMFTHSKKSETRASFSSLIGIARQFHDDCKQHDPKLPQWCKLPAEDAKPKQASPAAGSLREFNMSMTSAPADALLSEAGFSEGKVVVHKPTGEKYRIKAFKFETVTLEPIVKDDSGTKDAAPKGAAAKTKKAKAQKDNEKPLEVNRMELLKGEDWQLSKKVETKFCTSIPPPLESDDLKHSIIVGLTKQAMSVEFGKSSEAHCVVQTAPDLKLFAMKDIKMGGLKLVGLTNNVSPTFKTGWKHIGSGELQLYCKSSNTYQSSSLAGKVFVAKFWCARESYNQDETNAEFTTKEVDLKVVDKPFKVCIPILINTKAIKSEDEIVVLKKDPIKDVEPAPKRRRS